MTDQKTGVRINKCLAELGLCSRREADQWIDDGRVLIDGQLATKGSKVLPETVLSVDGNVVERKKQDIVVIAYFKPVGVECTYDERNPRSIPHFLKYDGPRIFNIGRLDIASEGLLLLTNDGDLVNPILRARFNHEKEYIVAYDQPIEDWKMEMMSSGLDIGDFDRGPTKPCKVERLGDSRLKLILTEGRNRQIRRMAEALDLRVMRLKRVRVMNIKLGDLKRGEWRHLTEKELSDLKGQLDFTTK